MKRFIHKYNTTAAAIDLTGAHPDNDWKGGRNLEWCTKMVYESDIDWQELPCDKLEECVGLPEDAVVKSLSYKVYIHTLSPYLEEYGTYNHCDFPAAMARQMADDEDINKVVTGIKVDLCAVFDFPKGSKDCEYNLWNKTFKLKQYMLVDSIITPDQPEENPTKPYNGSPHIAYLLDQAIAHQDWKDPSCLPLSEYPLQPTELSSLYKRAVGDITLTVYLGQRGNPPDEKYITLSDNEFPAKLIDKLLEDDNSHRLDDIASMKIEAMMTIYDEPLTMERTHILNDEDKNEWYPQKPLEWDICKVSVNWRADRHYDSDERIFARPGTSASQHYPNLVAGHPMSLNNLTGSDLFPNPIFLNYGPESITFSYGKEQYTVTTEKAFQSDDTGRDYTTFWLSIKLELTEEGFENNLLLSKKNKKKASNQTIFDIKDGVLTRCTVNTPRVEIPDSVTTIGYRAFCLPGQRVGQKRLAEVVIPSSVTKIEDEAFYECPNLQTAMVLGPADIGQEVFFGCKRLHNVYLADGVRSIGKECFAYCEALKSVFIPSSVATVGYAIAQQNDSDFSEPLFFCERKGPAENWSPNFDLTYRDPRFNNERNTTRHKVYYGLTRLGFMRQTMDWAMPAKPDNIPDPPNNSEDVMSRVQQFYTLLRQHRWADALDLIYIPQRPYDGNHKSMLDLFYSIAIINRLRADQVEKLRHDSANRDNATACYLYSLWLRWNATHFNQLKEVEDLAISAAEAGFSDMWDLLHNMYANGANFNAKIDTEKAATYKRLMDESECFSSLFNNVKSLLYGWDGVTDPDKALRMTQEYIEKENLKQGYSDKIFTYSLLAECHMLLGDRSKAEEYARKSIFNGGLNNPYRILCECHMNEEGTEWLPGDEELGDTIINAGADAGAPILLYRKAMSLKELADQSEGLQRKLLQLDARVAMEKAAFLGDITACFTLVQWANNGEVGFYREQVTDTYPFLLRGAMSMDPDCAFFLYRLQSIALDGFADSLDREFNLPPDADHSSPSVWRAYAKALYQANDIPWPEE